jgi:DNA ligase-associated metallophosphoesterase
MLTVPVAGELLTLLPEKAAYLAERQLLLIADAHIGKAVSFRRLGVPVPQGSTADNLANLSALVARLDVRRIVFLGDLLHSAHAQSAATQAAVAQWREVHRDLDLTLVRGNHDDRAGDPPVVLGIKVVDEPLRLGPWALCHHPDARPDGYVLAGHLHPCVTLQGRARERLRLPCFWFGDQVGVLPAFGAFTGMHPIVSQPPDRVYALTGDAVVEVPR